MSASVANGAPPARKQLLPFLWGSKQQWVQIAQIAFASGAKAPTTKIPKNGYLSKLRFRFTGSINVGTAGTGTAQSKLYNIIQSYVLSFNGGFQYRNLDGHSLYMLNNIQQGTSVDAVLNNPQYLAYNPSSATNQNFQVELADEISLNTGLNGDTFLLAAQARNADITLDITFGTNPTGSGANETTFAMNTEIGTITGTLFIEGLYMLDPDYSTFAGPDLTDVQQIISDPSFTNVVAGADNYVPITPINGPQYMQLAFYCKFNNVSDPGGPTSNISRVRLRLNNNQDEYDYTLPGLQSENFEHWGRSLPGGWYVFDWLDDVSLVNAVSPVGRNIISTEKIASLSLIVTVNSGVTVTNSVIKLLKRIKTPAISI